jgi:5-methylcytosine-specific restriction enzyme A
MRRTAMPRRRTGLVRRTALERKALAIRRRSTGPRVVVVDLVYERAGYSCELDGAPVGPDRGMDHHIHHRRPRRAGGSARPDTNSAANLLLLCPPCHEVIETQRTAAVAGGWLLHDGQDPARTPVLIGAERWLYLTADGRYAAELQEVA